MNTVSATRYLGATGRDLAGLSWGERALARLDPRALFPRRGMLSLVTNRLLLTGWEQDATVTVHASEVARIDIAFAPSHQRLLVGGLREPDARPIAVRHANGETLYLLINQRWLPTRNDNAVWAALLTDWLRAVR